jgi:hypothetical protein
LRTFGEIGISHKKTKKIQGKPNDRGLPSLWVGYANHAEDVCKFMHLKTMKIIMSRNVIWLDKNYATFNGMTAVNVEQITPIEVDCEVVEAEIDLEIDGIEDNYDVPAAARTRFHLRERKRLRKIVR